LSLLWLLPWSRVRLPQRAVQTSADDAPTLGVLLRQPSLWGTSLGLFSSNYTFYFMLNWLPSYVVGERGFSTAEMASLTGGAYAVHALSALLAGWGIDRFVTRDARADVACTSRLAVAPVGRRVCVRGGGRGTRRAGR